MTNDERMTKFKIRGRKQHRLPFGSCHSDFFVIRHSPFGFLEVRLLQHLLTSLRLLAGDAEAEAIAAEAARFRWHVESQVGQRGVVPPAIAGASRNKLAHPL